MTMPQNFDQLYPGRFLKAGHFEQPRTLTIRHIEHQELEGDKGKETKTIFHFQEERLALVACKTNGICCREIFGNNVPGWIGKRVTLHASTWNNEPCIRVYGSPELERDKEIVVQLPRRKAFPMLLRATGMPRGERANAGKLEPPKRERSQRERSYLDTMAKATSLEQLGLVEEAITNDNDLTPEETQSLARHLLRRQEQLKSPPPTA